MYQSFDTFEEAVDNYTPEEVEEGIAWRTERLAQEFGPGCTDTFYSRDYEQTLKDQLHVLQNTRKR